MSKTRWLFRPNCPDELFTDREDWLKFLYQQAVEAKKLRTTSTALIGLRRLGKTELFRRVHTKLFWEQDEVVPIYFTFEGKDLVSKDFAEVYLRNFLHQYIAKRTNNIRYFQEGASLEKLLSLSQEMKDEGLLMVLRRYKKLKEIEEEQSTIGNYAENSLLELAINAPRYIADESEVTVVVFVDEFQEVIKIRNSNGNDPNAVGMYQNAVEGLTCPHFITGSSMTLIMKDILEKGPLYARFMREYIRGLEKVHAAELAKRIAKVNGMKISEEMAVHLADRTGGNPFYIKAIMNQARLLNISLDVPKELNESIATDLTKGAIYSELSQQVDKFVYEQNDLGLGRRIIFYLSELPEDAIITHVEMQDILSRTGRLEDFTAMEIRSMFRRLARADLLEELLPGGESFSMIRDPILNEFLKVYKRIEGDKKTPDEVKDEKIIEYKKKIKQIDEYKGVVAERFIELLMMKWANEEVDGGSYFNTDNKVLLPRFNWTKGKRLSLPGFREVQIDIIGKKELLAWLVESKYWIGKKVSLGEVKEFEEKCKIAGQALEIEEAVCWFFSKEGFTQEAEEYMKEKGILYSDHDGLNRLLTEFGIRRLPDMV
ncbi:MAG: ATP-binding protein [bacterium]|nr:ATP-binding protein [bacterium]